MFSHSVLFFGAIHFVGRSRELVLSLRELLGASKNLLSELAFWAFLIIELVRYGKFLLGH